MRATASSVVGKKLAGLVVIGVMGATAVALPILERTITPGAGPFNGLNMVLADFLGDGHVEVVAQSDDGNVYILDPRTGGLLARFAPGTSGCTGNCYSFEGVSGPINAPSVSDLDKNGRLDVVLAHTSATVARFEFDPAGSSTTHYSFVKKWVHRYNQYQSFTTMDATPAVADLNGDGTKEVVVVAEQRGVFALRADGSTLWSSGLDGGHASPSIRDMDGDGRPEVVIAGDGGVVSEFSGTSGAVKWSFSALRYLTPASIPMAATLADLTGDGLPDVSFMARDAHDATHFGNDHAMLFVLDHTGRLLWRAQPGWAPPLSHTRPIVVSVNGHLSLLGGTWNTIGHKPGNFERVGPGQVFLFDSKGHETWHRDLNAEDSDKDLAVADVVGDGTQQVIAPGTQNGQDGYLLFDLATGASRGFLPGPVATRSNVAVGDLFGDGKFAMAAAVRPSGGGIQIWHGAQTLKAAFPGWGATTVVRGSPGPLPPPTSSSSTPPTSSPPTSSSPSSSPPTSSSTPPPSSSPSPSPTGSTFSATFTPRNGNEWWIQSIVSASGPLAGVDANVNNGPWIAMTHQSYGDWTVSTHAPAGSIVHLRARATDGSTATSQGYVWPV